MITIMFLLGWALFTSLMSIYVLGGYYIILWFFLGYVAGLLTVLLSLIFHVYAWQKLPLMSRFKYYGWQSTANFVSRFMFNLSIKVEGRKNIPKDGKMVVYTNHKSY